MSKWTPPPLPDIEQEVFAHTRTFVRGDELEAIGEIMRDYAKLYLKAWLAQQEPVAWTSVFGSRLWCGAITKNKEVADGWEAAGGKVVPLYRLDGGDDA